MDSPSDMSPFDDSYLVHMKLVGIALISSLLFEEFEKCGLSFICISFSSHATSELVSGFIFPLDPCYCGYR